jgi:glycerol-3-phosphate acyltransferase PlsY
MDAAGSLPLILYLLEKPLYMIITSAIIALLICFAHRENLQRIFNGSEAKWRNRIS